MIALPFHPSNTYTIREFKENMEDILRNIDATVMEQLSLKEQPESLLHKIKDGKFMGRSGRYRRMLRRYLSKSNACSRNFKGQSTGSGNFWLSCYPGSMPVMQALTKNGAITDLMGAGASIRSCFCGPCFGAGDAPGKRCFLHPSLHP